ncbi:unnamed protein product [Caenorhabditis sp. 36 PRJEB53466]|nr:unnamed protein product [Caenorhabditis sp. 36 PRJEB53466]
MKTSLIALTLLLTVSSILGAIDSSRQKCTEDVNRSRKMNAVDYNIADMNQLKYDATLERCIHRRLSEDSCPVGTNVIGSIETDTQKCLFLQHTKNSTFFGDFNGINEHASTGIACLKSRCEKTGEEYVSYALDDQESHYQNGPPGSKCPSGRHDEDGLCAVDQ